MTTIATAPATPSLRAGLELERLGPGFGAIVHGIDLRRPTEVQMEQLRGALVEHKVLFFRGQDLADAWDPDLLAVGQDASEVELLRVRVRGGSSDRFDGVGDAAARSQGHDSRPGDRPGDVDDDAAGSGGGAARSRHQTRAPRCSRCCGWRRGMRRRSRTRCAGSLSRHAAGAGGGQHGPQCQDKSQDEEDGASDDGCPRCDRQAARPADRLLGIGRAGQTDEVVQGLVPGALPDAHAFNGRFWGGGRWDRIVCPVESTRTRPPVATGLRRQAWVSGPGGRERRRCRGLRGPHESSSPRRPGG